MKDKDDVLRDGITIQELMDEFGVTLSEAKVLRARLDHIQQELEERGYIIFKKPDSTTGETS